MDPVSLYISIASKFLGFATYVASGKGTVIGKIALAKSVLEEAAKEHGLEQTSQKASDSCSVINERNDEVIARIKYSGKEFEIKSKSNSISKEIEKALNEIDGKK